MPVRMFNAGAKEAIVNQFHTGSSINYLALTWGSSRRTIIRVLEEAGVDPGIKRIHRTKSANQVHGLIPIGPYKVNPSMAEQLEIIRQEIAASHTQPWYRRAWNQIKKFFQ